MIFQKSQLPSLCWFTELINSNDIQPVVFKEAFLHWKAVACWSDQNYIRRAALNGECLVPVEVGSSYVDPHWTQKIMTFNEFLDDYVLAIPNLRKGYLAQYDLFTHLPILRDDIEVPDYCFAYYTPSQHEKDDEGGVITNAWFGPQGTVSPLHFDPKHNIFVQVVGYKHVMLCKPEDKVNIYPHFEKSGSLLSNTSQVWLRNLEQTNKS
jgi:lysine-specific demethylase 8